MTIFQNFGKASMSIHPASETTGAMGGVIFVVPDRAHSWTRASTAENRA